jgi:hypothetical protein
MAWERLWGLDGLTSVFWTSGDCSRALSADFLFQVLLCAARVDAERLWSAGRNRKRQSRPTKQEDVNCKGHSRKSNLAVQLVCRNQRCLARIPPLEHLGGRGTPENARVDEPGELDVGNVSAGAVYALKVPDCFGAGRG